MPFHRDSDGAIVFMSEEEKLRLRAKAQARNRRRPQRSAVGLVAAYYAAKAEKGKEANG